MMEIKNLINGEMIAPVSGNYFPTTNPAKGIAYAKVPDSDQRDVALAAEAAEKAFSAWSTMQPSKRSALLNKVADLIDENLEKLAEAEVRDTGKPLSLARKVDIPRASENFRFFAAALLHFSSQSHMMEGVALNYTTRSPLGVVGCISPWNLPLYLFSWKVAPALATGNCVIAKPSELTPMTAYLLGELCIAAGIPPGVINIVQGLGTKAGQAIVEHPNIAAISFTGGTATGKRIAATAAPMFKKLSLELGGKNPNIIFADCDMEKAVEVSIKSSFSNQGQICLCGSRIFIEESAYDDFRNRFIKKVIDLKIGDPFEGDTDIGALISEAHMQKVLSYIDLAKKEGGKILTGGKHIVLEGAEKNGYYISPTVIEGLAPECRTNLEEIFGPVVTLTPFRTEEEVLNYANCTDYGLSATIWTNNLTRAHKLAHALKSGVVWVNTWLLRDLRTPFGGMKQSGMGREGGEEVLRFFTEPKNICIKL